MSTERIIRRAIDNDEAKWTEVARRLIESDAEWLESIRNPSDGPMSQADRVLDKRVKAHTKTLANQMRAHYLSEVNCESRLATDIAENILDDHGWTLEADAWIVAAANELAVVPVS